MKTNYYRRRKNQILNKNMYDFFFECNMYCVYLVWTFLVLPSRSTCPAAYLYENVNMKTYEKFKSFFDYVLTVPSRL